MRCAILDVVSWFPGVLQQLWIDVSVRCPHAERYNESASKPGVAAIAGEAEKTKRFGMAVRSLVFETYGRLGGEGTKLLRDLVGSTPLRTLSMCCSTTQLSVNFIKTSASVTGRNFRGQGCGNCCPGSGFFGPQSKGAIVAAVQSSAVWCGTTACVHVPIQSRSTAGPPPERLMAANVSNSPATGTWLGRQHHSPRHALDQFRWWERNFRCGLLESCTLHFDTCNLMFSCVNSNQRVYLSGGLRVLRCAHTGLQDL